MSDPRPRSRAGPRPAAVRVRPDGMAPGTAWTTLLALARSCHPAPTAAVTSLSCCLAAAAGAGPGRTLLVGFAVGSGQVGIGWSNDLLDRHRDVRSGRGDKPLAAGALAPRVVVAAVGASLVLCAGSSLTTGAQAGALHLTAVAGGWAYNLGLKRTWASWLPYASSFGLLPAYLFRAAGVRPASSVVAAGSLLGVGAHLLNALPDIDDDRRTGVPGLPVLLGPTRTRVVGALLLGAAGTVLALASPRALTPCPVRLERSLFAASLGLSAGALLGGASRPRLPFRLAVAAAGVDVALLVIGARSAAAARRG